MNKNAIRTAFNKAAKTYDAHCAVQKKIADRSLALLLQHAAQFDRIADIACGTGVSTLQLIQAVSYRQCYAIDFSEKLLEQAKIKLPAQMEYIHADFDDVLFDSTSLNLIFCNMGLHWSTNLMHTLNVWNHALVQQGFLLFSIPIADHFPEIQKNFKLTVWQHEDLLDKLEAANFSLVDHAVEMFVEAFPNPLEALRSLKYVGANYHDRSRQSGLAKFNLEKIFVNRNEAQLTYKLGIYLLRKNK